MIDSTIRMLGAWMKDFCDGYHSLVRVAVPGARWLADTSFVPGPWRLLTDAVEKGLVKIVEL